MKSTSKYVALSLLSMMLLGCGGSDDQHSIGWEPIPRAITLYETNGTTAFCVTNETASSGRGLTHIESSKEFYGTGLDARGSKTCKSLAGGDKGKTAKYEYKNDYHHETKKIFDSGVLEGCEITKINSIGQVSKGTTAYRAAGDECGSKALWRFERKFDNNGNIVSFSYRAFDEQGKAITNIASTSFRYIHEDAYRTVLQLNFKIHELGSEEDNHFLVLNQLPIKLSGFSAGDEHQLYTALDSSGRPESGELYKNRALEVCYERRLNQMRSYDSSGRECDGNLYFGYSTIIDY